MESWSDHDASSRNLSQLFIFADERAIEYSVIPARNGVTAADYGNHG
jgi:hypothetical protein